MKAIDFDQIFKETRVKVVDALSHATKESWKRLPWRTKLAARLEMLIDPVTSASIHQHYGALLACTLMEQTMTDAVTEAGRFLTPTEAAQMGVAPSIEPRPTPTREIH